VAIIKKRDTQMESRLLLESGDAVELPPAEISEANILVQFDRFRPFIPELVDELRFGATIDPVAIMNDGSTFAIECETRTFWIKLWHKPDSDLSVIERVQVISCLPISPAVQLAQYDDPVD
jgi:hypothetical protein